MPGAELLVLLDPGQITRVRECAAHLVGRKSDHDVDPRGLQATRGAQYMAEQRLAREVMQHFGQFRIHPRALTRGEHDDFEAHGKQSMPETPGL